jgi:hypothetical protein
MTEGQTTGRGIAVQPRWRVVLNLLGGFAGLCTLFALVTTALGAWVEHTQARWPEAAARIEKCRLDPTSTGRRDRYYINCLLSYEVGDKEILARVDSARVPGPQVWQYPRGQFERLQEWVDEHPEGTPIAVHYNPANPKKVALVVTDMPGAGPRTPSNLKVLCVFAAACAVLLGMASIGR